ACITLDPGNKCRDDTASSVRRTTLARDERGAVYVEVGRQYLAVDDALLPQKLNLQHGPVAGRRACRRRVIDDSCALHRPHARTVGRLTELALFRPDIDLAVRRRRDDFDVRRTEAPAVGTEVEEGSEQDRSSWLHGVPAPGRRKGRK